MSDEEARCTIAFISVEKAHTITTMSFQFFNKRHFIPIRIMRDLNERDCTVNVPTQFVIEHNLESYLV